MNRYHVTHKKEASWGWHFARQLMDLLFGILRLAIACGIVGGLWWLAKHGYFK